MLERPERGQDCFLFFQSRNDEEQGERGRAINCNGCTIYVTHFLVKHCTLLTPRVYRCFCPGQIKFGKHLSWKVKSSAKCNQGEGKLKTISQLHWYTFANKRSTEREAIVARLKVKAWRGFEGKLKWDKLIMMPPFVSPDLALAKWWLARWRKWREGECQTGECTESRHFKLHRARFDFWVEINWMKKSRECTALLWMMWSRPPKANLTA